MTDTTRPVFEPLNELERLLVGATGGDPDARAGFEAAVLVQPLWAALTAGAQPDGPDGDTIRLRSLAQKDGRPATAVFTARERLTASMGADAEAVSWPGRALLETIRENPAVLNPGHGYGVSWNPDAIAMLIGRPNQAPQARVPTHVATPAETPPGLVEGLTRELTADPVIKAAWLALARWPDDEAPGFFLDIRADASATAIPALIQRALVGVDMDTRLDVVVGAPDKVPADAPGAGLELVRAR